MMANYLSVEEQFKDTLNNDQISRIEDQELREIRCRHWNYRHKIFLDEHGISDEELCRLAREDRDMERKELDEYKKRKGYV